MLLDSSESESVAGLEDMRGGRYCGIHCGLATKGERSILPQRIPTDTIHLSRNPLCLLHSKLRVSIALGANNFAAQEIRGSSRLLKVDTLIQPN